MLSLLRKLSSPMYFAEILIEPDLSFDVISVAWPFSPTDSAPSSTCDLPFTAKNIILPVKRMLSFEVTVAVRLTD